MNKPAVGGQFVVFGALSVVVISISSSAILVREAVATGLVIAFWRNTFGAAVLSPFALRRVRRDSSMQSALRENWRLIGLSGIALGVHFALWLEGLQLTTVAASVTLVTMSPVFVAVGSVFVLKEPIRRSVWLGIALAILGGAVVGWVGIKTTETATNPTLGNIMSFGGGAAVSVYILLGRRLRSAGLPTTIYASCVYAVAAVVLLVAVVVSGDTLFDLSGRTWTLIVAMVVGPQLLGHTLLNFVLDRTSATLVSVVTLLEPFGSALLAWWILSEVPNTGFWVGAPVVLVGLVVTVNATRTISTRLRRA